ncbi:MAG: CopG family transcriptional regulator [Thermodesulfobacteriota bacterium]
MGTNYVTTNIRLPKEMLRLLKQKAIEEEKSTAQLIREAIEEVFIKKERKLSGQEFKEDPFFKIVGMFDDGIKDGSVHHDRDIYGTD